MANNLQTLNETIRVNGGQKIADNEQDTEAVFRFATSEVAATVARQAEQMGAHASQWESYPNTVYITIR